MGNVPAELQEQRGRYDLEGTNSCSMSSGAATTSSISACDSVNISSYASEDFVAAPEGIDDVLQVDPTQIVQETRDTGKDDSFPISESGIPVSFDLLDEVGPIISALPDALVSRDMPQIDIEIGTSFSELMSSSPMMLALEEFEIYTEEHESVLRPLSLGPSRGTGIPPQLGEVPTSFRDDMFNIVLPALTVTAPNDEHFIISGCLDSQRDPCAGLPPSVEISDAEYKESSVQTDSREEETRAEDKEQEEHALKPVSKGDSLEPVFLDYDTQTLNTSEDGDKSMSDQNRATAISTQLVEPDSMQKDLLMHSPESPHARSRSVDPNIPYDDSHSDTEISPLYNGADAVAEFDSPERPVLASSFEIDNPWLPERDVVKIQEDEVDGLEQRAGTTAPFPSPKQPTPSLGHTAERPNWALAPNEECTKPSSIHSGSSRKSDRKQANKRRGKGQSNGLTPPLESSTLETSFKNDDVPCLPAKGRARRRLPLDQDRLPSLSTAAGKRREVDHHRTSEVKSAYNNAPVADPGQAALPVRPYSVETPFVATTSSKALSKPSLRGEHIALHNPTAPSRDRYDALPPITGISSSQLHAQDRQANGLSKDIPSVLGRIHSPVEHAWTGQGTPRIVHDELQINSFVVRLHAERVPQQEQVLLDTSYTFGQTETPSLTKKALAHTMEAAYDQSNEVLACAQRFAGMSLDTAGSADCSDVVAAIPSFNSAPAQASIPRDTTLWPPSGKEFRSRAKGRPLLLGQKDSGNSERSEPAMVQASLPGIEISPFVNVDYLTDNRLPNTLYSAHLEGDEGSAIFKVNLPSGSTSRMARTVSQQTTSMNKPTFQSSIPISTRTYQNQETGIAASPFTNAPGIRRNHDCTQGQVTSRDSQQRNPSIYSQPFTSDISFASSNTFADTQAHRHSGPTAGQTGRHSIALPPSSEHLWPFPSRRSSDTHSRNDRRGVVQQRQYNLSGGSAGFRSATQPTPFPNDRTLSDISGWNSGKRS
ncbi:hypothetical protein D9613_005277 [Agrocybe pediades]|uniref:Uncharacterized protein n=1 Tax=Agrocybe pediades TaxID=84607 RepID=A0A8H4VR96_9AGAR|nr:hypothetical protein D9613_005277 [Agrocybe pediades]